MDLLNWIGIIAKTTLVISAGFIVIKITDKVTKDRW